MERTYSEYEMQALRACFTGADARASVYSARPLISNPTWGYLAGAYSRSTLTMREKYLDTLRSVVSEACGGFDVDVKYKEALNNIAEGRACDMLTGRVEKFLSKWGVDYGHASLKDSSHEHLAIEGVTLRAAKWLEWHPLGAYQEKSTRYVDFSKEEPILRYFPPCDRETARSLYARSVSLYEDIMNAAMLYYGFNDSHSVAASKTLKAKSFDIARYVIPAYAPTSLGVTIASRSAEELVRYLVSHENMEANEIGASIKAALLEVNPALIKHVSAEPVYARDCAALSTMLDIVAMAAPEAQDRAVYQDLAQDVSLITPSERSPQHPRWQAAAALIADAVAMDERETLSLAAKADVYAAAHPAALSSIWQSALSNRGPHQEFPDSLDSIFLRFEGILDFGAFRDLQRHRRGVQPHVNTERSCGWSVPSLLALRKYAKLKSRYDQLMSDFDAFRESLVFSSADDSPYRGCAQYALCLGHNVHYTYTCSVKQLAYLVELRTGLSGHDSYRHFCQGMARIFLKAVPEAAPYLRVDWSETGSRLQDEIVANQKREALHEST